MFKKIIRAIDINFEPVIATFLFIVIILFVTLDVILRFVFQAGLSWSEELIRYLFVWIVFFCFSYATRLNRHIRFTFLVNILPEHVSKIVLLITDIIFFALSVLLFYFATQIVEKTFHFGDMAVTIKVSLNILYLTGVVGLLLNVIRVIQNIVWKIKHMKSPLEIFSFYKSDEDQTTIFGYLEPMGSSSKSDTEENENNI